MNTYLDFATELAYRAGDIMRTHFTGVVERKEKPDKTIVTIADETINRMVIEAVQAAYPDHGVSGEEESASGSSQYVWVCDPVDGTVPFSRGVPISVFSLALVKDGVPQLGVVYDPQMDRLYSAELGKGAFMNGSPISVSSAEFGRKAILNVEWWGGAEYDVTGPMIKLANETGVYVLSMGSVTQAACLVASGKYEACLFPGGEGKHVDVAAVKVIIEEAGGKVSDFFGNDQRYDQAIKGAVMSNGIVHEEILKALAE